MSKHKYTIIFDDGKNPSEPTWRTNSDVSATARLTILMSRLGMNRYNVAETLDNDGCWTFHVAPMREPT